MNVKSMVILSVLTSSIALSGCNATDGGDISQEQCKVGVEEKENNAEVNKDINLSFEPVIPKELVKSDPNEEWIKAKTIKYWEMAGQKETTVHLYIDNTQKRIENADVYAYLEHKGNLYIIGHVGSYGLESISINSVDRTSDGINEIEIIGGVGAAYVQMVIVSYNKEKDDWIKLVQMGSPEVVDLDQDGKKELIATSRGSIPPFVHIYRWNGNQFEMADVERDKRNNFARLRNQTGSYIIETGHWEYDKPVKSDFYKYDNGKLVKISEQEQQTENKALPSFKGTVSELDYSKMPTLEIPKDKWQTAKEEFAHKKKESSYSDLKLSDFDHMESWQGTLNTKEFQLDLYFLDSSYLLVIVQKYGEELRVKLSSTHPYKAFLFYDDSVWMVIASKGIGQSYNIATGEFESNSSYDVFDKIFAETHDLWSQVDDTDHSKSFDISGSNLELIRTSRLTFVVK
jgi:predicted small secreted protein